MKDKIEYKGYWWLPKSPDKTVAGILTYLPNEKIKLELIGTFDPNDTDIIFCDKSNNENIIYGLTSDSNEITLINCHSYASLNLSCPFPIVNYNCQYLVIGKHLEDYNQECFNKSYITIPQLSHWCSPRALRISYLFNKGENSNIKESTISFDTHRPTLASVSIDDNTVLNIESGITYHGDYFSPKIEQYTYLEILKQKDVSISDLYSNVFMFEQFLSLATLQTVKCAKITLFDKTIFQELDNGKKFYHPIQLIYIQREINQPANTKKHDFLFDYDSISEQYPQIIKKWYAEKTDIAPIRAHLINSIQSNKVFSSTDFLIVIQALEGFCTRFRTEAKLTHMLEAIISEFVDIDVLKDDNIVIRQVVDSRHYYSHFMNKSKKPNTLDGIELYDLTIKLRKLLICCMLNFIGFDNSQINQILNKSNSNLLHR